jgi:hypothetical protein
MLKFLYRHRLTLLLLVLLVALSGCGSIDDPKTTKTLTTISTALVFIIQGISFFAVAVATQLGKLMSSYYILDSGMGETLYNTWSVIRNFVNVAFVLLLLIIAVRVILGFGENGLDTLKKMLPKFVLALIAVNLTFFGARVILTASDVLTTAVYTIPRTVGGQNLIRSIPCEEKYWSNQDECLNQIGKKFEDSYKALEANGGEFKSTVTDILASTAGQMPLERVGTRTIPLAILVNFIDLQKILTITAQTDIWTFITKSLGIIAASGVVALSFIVLFIAFVVRMVMLWVMIVISPAAVLLYVLKDVVPVLGESSKGIKEFVNYAFMPVYTAVPLSLGLVMILANSSIRDYGVDIKVESFFSGDLNSLIWFIAAIIIIWVGTKEAIKKGGELAASVSGHVSGAIEGVAKNVAGAAQYIPFIPTGGAGGEKMSLGEIPAMGRGINTYWANKQATRVENRLDKMGLGSPSMSESRFKSAIADANHGGSVAVPAEALKRMEALASTLVNGRGGERANKEVADNTLLTTAKNAGANVASGMTVLQVLAAVGKKSETVRTSAEELRRQAESRTGETLPETTPPTAPTIPGITPSAPGLITAEQAKSGNAKESGVEIDGKKLWEVSIKDQKVYFVPTSPDKPAEGGQIAFSDNDIKEAIKPLNQKSDADFIDFVKSLPKQIAEQQKDAILREFQYKIKDRKVDAGQIEDYAEAFKGLGIDADAFKKIVEERFKKEGDLWEARS